MPPKQPYKQYPLLLKTHKLTIFLEAAPASSISSVKETALSALTSRVCRAESIPEVSGVDEFEICKEVKEKGRATGKYELLEEKEVVRDVLAPWEVMFVRFRDSAGRLRPVEVKLASLTGDDEEETVESQSKGKRKAPPL